MFSHSRWACLALLGVLGMAAVGSSLSLRVVSERRLGTYTSEFTF
jgi:hypothetical protein